jgi:hypothetical protein
MSTRPKPKPHEEKGLFPKPQSKPPPTPKVRPAKK